VVADGSCPWLVRIMNSDAQVPHGAGVLLGAGQILTCARVVAAALGVGLGREAPAGAVRVDFPGCETTGESPRALRARADEFGWLPRFDAPKDIAILNLEGDPPADAQPPVFRHCDGNYGGLVRVFGHPQAVPEGIWSVARLVGLTRHNELAQLDGHSEHPIGPGFEGAGVIDLATGEVIGCVMEVVRADSEARVAWMMPLEKVLDYLPDYKFILPPAPERAAETTAEPHAPASQTAATTAIAPTPAGDADSARAARHGGLAGLSPDQRAMIDALSALVDAEPPDWMDDLVARLTARIGQFFAVPSRHGGTAGIAGLVLACLAQPGGMHELRDELYRRYGEPAPPALRELDQLVLQSVPDPLLTPRERQVLYELIADTYPFQAAEAYSQAAGPVGIPLPTRAGDVIAMAGQLEGFNGPPGGLPPLIAFAESLARVVSPAKARQLGRWVKDYRERARLPEQLSLPFAIGYATAGPSASEPAYLVIQLDADRLEKAPPRLDQTRFSVTAWLQRGSGFGDPLRRATQARRLWQVRSSLMDELLTEAQQKLGASAAVLTVEFILPRDLLWYADVDQWPAGRESPGKKLGEVYPVVVRSLERMNDGEIRPRWERKWAWAKANCGRPDPWAYRWLPEEGQLAPEEMFRRLSDDRLVCLALGYPPSRPHGLSRDEISVGLQAGLPIMVWYREGQQGAIEAGLMPLLTHHALLELPQLVAGRRAEAGRRRESRQGSVSDPAGGDDLARHLTLLFDPADRFPEPEMASQAPQ